MQRNLLQTLAALAAVARILCANLAFCQEPADWSASSLGNSYLGRSNPALGNPLASASGLTELAPYSPNDSATADQASQGPTDPAVPARLPSGPDQPGQSQAGSRSMSSAFGPTLSGCGLKPGYGIGDPCPQCDDCPTHAIVGLVGYDSFRGIADDSWQNNGIHTGFNYGTRLGKFSELTGIGFQIGGTIGIFDWGGSDYRPIQDKAQTQGFITYGLFRKANENCRWSAAVVQDWMINNNYGEYSQNPTLSQLRGQVGYAANAWNEFGLWGACRTLNATSNISGLGPTTWRAVNQLNPYWHYKWGPGGADTLLWIGVPDNQRLAGGGSLGNWIAGAQANVPLSDGVGLYTLVTYMHASSSPGGNASTEEAWNFTVGLSFYPQRNSRSGTVAGQCWMPQLPVANNGTFMVDTNNH